MSEQPEPAGDAPDLEEILRQSQGMIPGHSEAISGMAMVYATWRGALQDTGQFTDEEAFELIRIMVAANAGGLRSLALSWGEAAGRTDRTQGMRQRSHRACRFS